MLVLSRLLLLPYRPPDDFRLGRPEDFLYLSQSGCYTVEGIDDAEEFKDTLVRLGSNLSIFASHCRFRSSAKSFAFCPSIDCTTSSMMNRFSVVLLLGA